MRKQETLKQREVNSSRAMLFHWKHYLLPKMDSFAVKSNNTFRFSLIAKQGLFSSNSQNKNHCRNKVGRRDLCSQALIHANMHENAMRGGSELQDCLPEDMQISVQEGQAPDARWLIDYLSSYQAANYLGWGSLV